MVKILYLEKFSAHEEVLGDLFQHVLDYFANDFSIDVIRWIRIWALKYNFNGEQNVKNS